MVDWQDGDVDTTKDAVEQQKISSISNDLISQPESAIRKPVECCRFPSRPHTMTYNESVRHFHDTPAIKMMQQFAPA